MGSELVASELVVTSPMTGGVDDAPAGDDGFALSGFPEFVRSGDGFCGDASRGLEVGELTDPVVAGAPAWLNKAASWSPVTHTSSPSDLEMQSFCVWSSCEWMMPA